MGSGRGSGFYPGDVMQVTGIVICLFAAGAMSAYAVAFQPAALVSGLILLASGVGMIVGGTVFEFADKWKAEPQPEVRQPEREQDRSEIHGQQIIEGQPRLGHQQFEHLESPQEFVVDASPEAVVRKAR